MSRIIGREKELKILEQAMGSETSQFIAVYGRRRVGKTFLIREAFQQDFAFYLTGVANSLFQLSDFYSLFYIRFIRGNHALNKNTWINGLDSPQQRSWSGYAFEQVCLAHLREIKHALGISGVQTSSSFMDQHR
ncbi:ATP-binding protein [Chitinophaga sp. 30R24]|uniref:ATP-binding protein n=1 Tax=Chitinophaga sp. 30R24 TaxID=3248838 RepID=UPI003B8F3C6B